MTAEVSMVKIGPVVGYDGEWEAEVYSQKYTRTHMHKSQLRRDGEAMNVIATHILIDRIRL